MPKLYSARKLLTAFKRIGFMQVSQKGSHIKLKGEYNGELRTVIIPNHKEVPRGTFRSILRQAGMLEEELENYV